jgi:6-phosphogluconolactonase (cycloisomerase 2 family)
LRRTDSGSSLATLALQPNGIPWPPSLAVHPFVVEQPGPDSGRQSASFPHQALYDPTGHFVFITDLGADLVRIFSTSPGSGTGAAEPLTTVTLERGSGPRHMAFLSAPSQKPPTHLYVLCELSNTVLVFSLDYAEDFSTVSLALLQTTSTRLGDAPSPAGCIALASELAVHTGHGLLFAGNRWRHRESGAPPLGVNDDVAVFAIDDTKRTLSPLRMHGLGASNVRHFEISPCGEWMAVAGQGSGIVKVFAIQGWREAASVEVEAAAVVRWWRK